MNVENIPATMALNHNAQSIWRDRQRKKKGHTEQKNNGESNKRLNAIFNQIYQNATVFRSFQSNFFFSIAQLIFKKLSQFIRFLLGAKCRFEILIQNVPFANERRKYLKKKKTEGKITTEKSTIFCCCHVNCKHKTCNAYHPA